MIDTEHQPAGGLTTDTPGILHAGELETIAWSRKFAACGFTNAELAELVTDIESRRGNHDQPDGEFCLPSVAGYASANTATLLCIIERMAARLTRAEELLGDQA